MNECVLMPAAFEEGLFKPGQRVKFRAPSHESMIGKHAIVTNVANAHERAYRDQEARKAGWPEGRWYDVRLCNHKKLLCDDGEERVPREFSVGAEHIEPVKGRG